MIKIFTIITTLSSTSSLSLLPLSLSFCVGGFRPGLRTLLETRPQCQQCLNCLRHLIIKLLVVLGRPDTSYRSSNSDFTFSAVVGSFVPTSSIFILSSPLRLLSKLRNSINHPLLRFSLFLLISRSLFPADA